MTLDRTEQDGPLLMGRGGRPFSLPRGEASPALSLGPSVFHFPKIDRELWENIPPFPQIPSCFSSSTDLFSREFTPSFLPHSQTANTRNVPNVEGFLCMKD